MRFIELVAEYPDRSRGRALVRRRIRRAYSGAADEQEAGFGDIDIGEAHIELRAQAIFGKRRDLLIEDLPLGDGFVGHSDGCLGAKNIEIGAVDGEQNVVAGRLEILRSGLGIEARIGDEVFSAAGIGDELINREPVTVCG